MSKLRFFYHTFSQLLVSHKTVRDLYSENSPTKLPSHELRSSRPKVDSPDSVSPGFARWHTTLYNTVNILISQRFILKACTILDRMYEFDRYDSLWDILCSDFLRKRRRQTCAVTARFFFFFMLFSFRHRNPLHRQSWKRTATALKNHAAIKQPLSWILGLAYWTGVTFFSGMSIEKWIFAIFALSLWTKMLKSWNTVGQQNSVKIVLQGARREILEQNARASKPRPFVRLHARSWPLKTIGLFCPFHTTTYLVRLDHCWNLHKETNVCRSLEIENATFYLQAHFP